MFKNKHDMSTAAIEWRKSRQHHKSEIKKLRRQVKKHKMLLKQAKLTFKISNKY